MTAATLTKQERLSSRRLTDRLFGGEGSQSMAAYPLRAIFLNKVRAQGEAPVQLLVSVPKKRFRHAVDRNRVKRQIRESFRLNKHELLQALSPTNQLLVAFVWLSDRHYPTADVQRRVVNLMRRMAEKL